MLGGIDGALTGGVLICRPRSMSLLRSAIRDSTFSGRPLGSAEFTRALEKQERRPLTRQKPGPKKHSAAVTGQAILSFDSF